MPQDIDLVRDFPGNPNPTPTPPEGGPRPAQASAPVGAVDIPTLETPAAVAGPEPAAIGAAEFVVKTEADGLTRRIIKREPGKSSTVMGVVRSANTPAYLDTVGVYNPGRKEWKISEAQALELAKGKPTLPEYWKQRWASGESAIVAGLNGSRALRGEITKEEALSRADAGALQAQMAEAPLLAWDNVLGDALNQGIKATGDAAEILPFIPAAAGQSATDAAILGGSAMAAAWLSLGTAGMATPAVVAGVGGMMSTGSAYGIAKFSADVEGGQLALELWKRGADDKTVKTVAPVAGLMSGLLEVAGFKFLTAPLKRTFARKVLVSPTVKSALTKWYIRYLAETGGEVAVEDAQELVSAAAEKIAAEVEAKPELYNTKEGIWGRLKDTTIKSARGLALIKAPGAALDIMGERSEAAAEEQAAAKTEVRITEYKDTGAAPATAETPAVPGAEKTVAEQTAAAVAAVKSGEKAPETLAEELSKIMAEEEKAPPSTIELKPISLKEEIRRAEVDTRVDYLESERGRIQGALDPLIETRAELTAAGTSTAALDKRINSLLDEMAEIDKTIGYYQSAEQDIQVARGVKLEVRPVTLEDIVQAGFKAGRKEVIKTRAEAIKAVAAENKLTQVDLRKVLRNKNIGLMGDVKFRNFMEEFKGQVAKVVERKTALRELQMLRREKGIKGEQHVRALHELPPINKMGTEQIKKYSAILGEYEQGDVALTPRRIQALETTPWAGAKTWREVLVKAAAQMKKPLEELTKDIKISEFDMFSYDTKLAGKGPFFNFLVSRVKEAEIKARTELFELRNKMYELGAKAIASRRRGLLGKLVPQQAEIMEYMEAEEDKKADLAAKLTPEELAFADFLESAYEDAYSYLLETGELQSSRFAGGRYVFHAKKPISEMLLGIKDQGVKAVFQEFLQRWKNDTETFSVIDTAGKALGLRKFFQQTLFRAGERVPTRNVLKASETYFTQFYHKKALDEAIPTIETLTIALRETETERGEEADKAHAALEGFVKTYLNAKKGQSAISGIRQGGKIDAGIRFINALISLKFIALNIPLQVASVAGETMAKIPVLGIRGLLKAQALKFSAQGRAILKKYQAFTGESVLEDVTRPGKNVEDYFNTLMYGLFQWNRVNTMQDILLGSLTEEELKTGEISTERLAQLKLTAGRWMDVGEAKSILGRTSAGEAFTKFRGWAIPVFTTMSEDLAALGRSVSGLGDPKKRLTKEQAAELYRVAETGAIALLVRSMAGDLEDDDSFTGKMIKYLMRELTTLFQALKPTTVLTAGVTVAFIEEFAKNLELLITLEEYKTKEGLVGADRLKRQFTPSAMKGNSTKPAKKRPEELW